MTIDITAESNGLDSALVLPLHHQPYVLTDIYKPENNIAIWQRSLSTELEHSIQELLDKNDRLALVKCVTPQNAAEVIQNKLAGHPCAKELSQDIALVVDMFCCLFDLREVGLRLTKLDKPMCPKFHVDQIPCRLVTTYAGSATQWLNNDNVDRRKLGAGSLGQPDHLSGVYKSELNIEQMSCGDIALLKGSGWEGNEDLGVVHRSPATALNGRRLILTLDMT